MCEWLCACMCTQVCIYLCVHRHADPGACAPQEESRTAPQPSQGCGQTPNLWDDIDTILYFCSIFHHIILVFFANIDVFSLHSLLQCENWDQKKLKIAPGLISLKWMVLCDIDQRVYYPNINQCYKWPGPQACTLIIGQVSFQIFKEIDRK